MSLSVDDYQYIISRSELNFPEFLAILIVALNAKIHCKVIIHMWTLSMGLLPSV